MLYREITAVCSDIHTKRSNTPRGQNVEFVSVNFFPGIGEIFRPGDSSRWLALERYVMQHSSSYSPSMTGRVIVGELGPTDEGLTLNTTPLFSQPDVVGS